MVAAVKMLDFVYCQFPKVEGGTLAHYGLVVNSRETASGTQFQVAYITSKGVDIASNDSPWTKEVHFSKDNFGKDFRQKSGLTLKEGQKGSRIDISRLAWFDAKQLEVVGFFDRNNAKAVRVLMRAIENCMR